jgi:S-DNA-T family DNA segregation ATPase FtsK/SpoIIIE
MSEKTETNKYIGFLKGDTIRFVSGVVVLLVTIYLLVAFTSFFFTGMADQSLIDNPDTITAANHYHNYAGAIGARVSNFFMNEGFGVASYLILLFFAILGLRLMGMYKCKIWKWFIGCSLVLVWCSVFIAFVTMDYMDDSFIIWGGMHGYNASKWLISQIGVPGEWLVLIFVFLCFLIYANAKTISWIRKLSEIRLHRNADMEGEELEEEETPETKTPATDIPMDVVDTTTADEDAEPVEPSPIPLTYENTAPADRPAVAPSADEEEGEDDEENYDSVERTPYDPRLDLENYKFPSIDLMKYYDSEPTINREEQEANKNKIIQTLQSFGIGISSIKATVGPTVTLYEITPQQGIRISKIRGLENDLALSLSAMGIRIIAPIPGKGTIGIEVPNSNPKIVSGQSIIGSKKFQESLYDLPIALGKTITNEVFMVDLCKMPHILVAGATGQGKSVGLNTIIASLLYKKHPAELKFVLVDPKMVEFSIYSILEHHYLASLPDGGAPIITDVTKVVQTLKSLCVEMDNRYLLLTKAHVRTIKEYNDKFIKRRLNPEKGHRFLPYIVVVIDEYGDLIMTAGKDIELPIARIAQKARAVGIHMIIATQRPTTNIITGTIKANFPARVAFRVTTSIDSRTILDRAGANQLIGRGDMLFLQGADPVRVQCAFIDTPEIERITQFIAEQQGYPTPYYLPEYVDDSEPKGGEGGDMDMDKIDPLFEKAAHLIVSTQQGSTSKIQREFSIGYNRAGRIMDQLERAGVVGPSEGSKPRDVLFSDVVALDDFLKNYLV